MNPTEQIRQLQMSLNLPVTGVMDPATTQAMNSAVAQELSSNPLYAPIVQRNSPEALAGAFSTGDWNGITTLSGKPFSNEVMQGAVTEAENALAPAYRAQQEYDQAGVQSTIEGQREGFGNFLQNEAQNFKDSKQNLDQNAADSGILYSGARTQKERDLKTLYERRQEQQAGTVARNIADTARGYQYKYGDEGASRLSSLYSLPTGNSYNASVAGGAVTPTSIRSAYDPSAYRFQGTNVVANKAASQVRAANILSNRANKLTSTGYKTQY